MRLGPLLVGLLLLAACEKATVPLTDDWVEFIDEEHGFRITYPPDWFRAEVNLTPNLASPQEVLSIGTFPLEPGGPGCANVPTNTLTRLGPEDAFLTMQGEASRPDSEDRPVFGPGVGISIEGLEFPYCLAEAERLEIGAMQWIHFSDAGRSFYLLVAIGRDASAETVDQVWMVANSLVIASAGDP
ncbi:MAG: hypothetical protein WD354_05735 [Acidimicrobiia bacterium]